MGLGFIPETVSFLSVHMYVSCCVPQCVIAHLENADVARLLRIFQYVQRYEADWEVAWLQAEQKEAEERKNEPMLADEDMLGEC